MNYKNETCAACGVVFNEDDDIVVCPDCGSPHHRECYMAANRCANISLHEKREKWKRAAADKAAAVPAPDVYSANAPFNADAVGSDAENAGSSPNENKQEQFNKPFDGGPDSVLTYLGFNPEEDMGGASLKEVSQFVGSNTLYYIPLFKRMKDFGSKISFNISCLLFPPLYFANRRMWGWAIISAILTVLLGLPEMLLSIPHYLDGVDGYEAAITLIYNNEHIIRQLGDYTGVGSWIMSIAFCMFGNWMYYKYVLHTVKGIKSSCNNEPRQDIYLMSNGGVKPINILIITIIMSGISLFLIYGAFMLMK